MQHGPIVPRHKIAGTPDVTIHKLALRGMLQKFGEQKASFWDWLPDNPSCVGTDKEGFSL